MALHQNAKKVLILHEKLVACGVEPPPDLDLKTIEKEHTQSLQDACVLTAWHRYCQCNQVLTDYTGSYVGNAYVDSDKIKQNLNDYAKCLKAQGIRLPRFLKVNLNLIY